MRSSWWTYDYGTLLALLYHKTFVMYIQIIWHSELCTIHAVTM